MASLLPVAEAPILRMYGGGGMVSMLPAAPPAPPVNIAAMSGGASLLPHAPNVPMIAMRGGADLYSIPYGAIHNNSVSSDRIASFGIVNSFSANESALPKTAPCAPMTETATPLCDILYPFVDRRVQALLTRVRFPSGNADIDMGCGRIVRKGQELTISFHEKAITLLSCDLTGTFAKFHEGMPRYTPLSVEKSDKGLLSWMLGSDVDENGEFNLITFMDSMKSPVLPLKGFRQFLSYHKGNVGDMDVLRYAMELYGYRTGAIANTKDLYGLILSPTNAVRRVNTKFSMYKDGVVTSGEWDSAWSTLVGGFAVFEPAPVGPAKAPTPSFSGKKMTTPVEVSHQQTIGGQSYTLRGMIQHAGGKDGGHYTYVYHSPTENKWVQFSDDVVTYPTAESITNEIRTGYIYLFEKQAHDSGLHKGIQNHGNSCWMNAALQMFYHLSEYRAYVERFREDTSALSKEINNITLAIKQIFQKYSTGDQVVACSTEYQTLFKYTFPNQPMGSQQDAMEFITKVLLRIIDNVPTVRDLFAIEYESMLTCSDTIIAPSTKKDPMNALSLVIPSTSTSLTLDALLTKEGEPEIMPSNTKVGDKSCPTVTKTVAIQIPSANQYVIIQLKRFT